MIGKFITFEGVEGAGKSTIIKHLQTYLTSANIPAIVTREPGGTEISEKIRALVLNKKHSMLSNKAELLLMFAARAQHVDEVIRPALAAGKWVICDRFADATYAYQGGGRKLDNQLLDFLSQTIHDDVNPDLTFLLDIDVVLGLTRASKRSEFDRFESQDLSFFEAVRSTYLTRANCHPERFKIIDASQPVEQVNDQVISTITSMVP